MEGKRSSRILRTQIIAFFNEATRLHVRAAKFILRPAQYVFEVPFYLRQYVTSDKIYYVSLEKNAD